MSHKKFNEVAVKYNLHLEHINFARREFENQATDFTEEQESIIWNAFQFHLADSSNLRVQRMSFDMCKRQTNFTSYWNQLSAPIYSLKEGYLNFQNTGTLTSSVTYNSDIKSFVWRLWFDNTNFLNSNIDENVKKHIDSNNIEYLKTSHHIKDDTIHFFELPIDQDFPENYELYIKESIEVLCHVLMGCDELKKVDDSLPENNEEFQEIDVA